MHEGTKNTENCLLTPPCFGDFAAEFSGSANDALNRYAVENVGFA